MTIKMGILGFGGMGNWHANNAPKIEGVEIISVHDIDEKRLDDAKKKGLKSFENRSDFLADDDINFVLIATPNHLHKDYAIEALKAGKNVMCEKPVTLSVSELDEIIEVSKKEGKLFTVHHNRRWDKDYRVMRKVIESNIIGKVHSIESKVHGNNGQIYGWRQKPEYGGGMVLDWGVHLLDHFTFMYPNNKIISVYAQTFSIINPCVDDLFKVELRFEDGLSVHVQVGTFGLIKQPRFIAYGDLGTMIINDFSGEKGEIKLLSHHINEMGKVIIDTPAGPTRTMAPQPEEYYKELNLPEVVNDLSELY
ncbi:MAG: Gfo/Idh/MocA family oxidoreductase, partial [Clostridiales bacterium]|nr:Gfo/Idh/MocA family oxidoreductase [Clostridiales bacterium]